jgi:hypothetical protein
MSSNAATFAEAYAAMKKTSLGDLLHAYNEGAYAGRKLETPFATAEDVWKGSLEGEVC